MSFSQKTFFKRLMGITFSKIVIFVPNIYFGTLVRGVPYDLKVTSSSREIGHRNEIRPHTIHPSNMALPRPLHMRDASCTLLPFFIYLKRLFTKDIQLFNLVKTSKTLSNSYFCPKNYCWETPSYENDNDFANHLRQ